MERLLIAIGFIGGFGVALVYLWCSIVDDLFKPLEDWLDKWR